MYKILETLTSLSRLPRNSLPRCSYTNLRLLEIYIFSTNHRQYLAEKPNISVNNFS